MLSVVRPIGYRCFFIHFFFLFLIAAYLFFLLQKHFSQKLVSIAYTGMTLFFLGYAVYVAQAYSVAAQVNAERIAYIEEQIASGADTIVIPGNVSFADWNASTLRYFYPVKFIVVDYETWIAQTKN